MTIELPPAAAVSPPPAGVLPAVLNEPAALGAALDADARARVAAWRAATVVLLEYVNEWRHFELVEEWTPPLPGGPGGGAAPLYLAHGLGAPVVSTAGPSRLEALRWLASQVAWRVRVRGAGPDAPALLAAACLVAPTGLGFVEDEQIAAAVNAFGPTLPAPAGPHAARAEVAAALRALLEYVALLNDPRAPVERMTRGGELVKLIDAMERGGARPIIVAR